ncbi:cytochrome P450, variant [Aulographum hederae CBS 113979]|uniref:Cytochrome P450, variant n=1 Tax=Aulographum hederae CBS 113979 TaxID=1176131 RepID=A0A6G1HCQ9_9PEZI|nr:cytochrome P450, variant [Aulographum hederae CBS 113979]
MATLTSRLPSVTTENILVASAVFFTIYLTSLAFHRLYLSPISHFPGPKFAALSKWYEFYYEVILRGKYSEHIAELHKVYGPIIRITPTEVHIKDAPFYETLFAKNAKSAKDPWFSTRFGNETSVFSTCDAAHHKLRRSCLNPYFSKRATDQCEPIVQSKITYASSKVKTDYSPSSNTPFNLARMWDAFSGDVIMEVSFGFSYNSLASPSFRDSFHDCFLALSEFGGLACQFPFLGPIMEAVPDWLVRMTNPPLDRMLTLIADLGRQVDVVKSEFAAGKKPQHPTVFHEMLRHDLPPEEFAPRRLRDEAQTVVGAGLTTTAWSITNACYYLIESAALQEKLHRELVKAIPDINAADAFALRKLEKLPFLKGCVKEGVRMSIGATGRIPRIWKTPLQFKEWVIPAGTTVSMNHQDILFDEEIFPQPGKMVPERWAGNPKAPDGNSLEQYFVAFGKGDRSCLGVNLALMEVTLALAHLFRKFRLELFETNREDVLLAHDFFLPSPKSESKGVRVKVVEIYEK